MNITDEMVERAARAGMEAIGEGPFPHGAIHSDYLNFARAALEAALTEDDTEWEYGACYEADNGREMLWFSMGGGGFAIREAAEREVLRYTDSQIRLCRRRKAGPWEPVEVPS